MIILIFIISIISWIYILKLIPGFWKNISLFLVFFIYFIGFNYIGFIYLLYNDFQTISYGNLNFYLPELNKIFYINTLVMWGMVCLYTLVSYKNLNRNFKIINLKPLILNRTFPLLMIILLVLFYYVRTVGFYNLPIIQVFSNASLDELLVARDNAANNVSRYHWYKLFFKDILSVVVSIYFLNFIINKTLKTRLYFLLTFSILLFTSLMTGEKALIIDIILVITCSYFILKKGEKINLKFVISIFGIVLGSVILTYLLFMPGSNTFSLLAGIFERFTLGQTLPGIYYLKMFPNVHEFLGGISFPNPMGIFNYTPYNLTSEVMDFSGLNAYGQSLGVKGTMPFFYWGELYANFNYIGIFVGVFLITYIIIFIDLYFQNQKLKNVWNIALYAYLI